MLKDLQAPVATRKPHPTHLHGETLEDDYFWLREKGSPEVTAYLEAENAYTAAVMEGTEELQERLYREMLSHIKETDTSLPYRDGGWFYYAHTKEGLQYPIQCRRRASATRQYDESAPEEVLLDVNQLAEGKPFMSLGALSVSPDGVHDRHYGLPAVHAGGERLAQWRAATRYSGASWIGDLDAGFSDVVLLRGG